MGDIGNLDYILPKMYAILEYLIYHSKFNDQKCLK